MSLVGGKGFSKSCRREDQSSASSCPLQYSLRRHLAQTCARECSSTSLHWHQKCHPPWNFNFQAPLVRKDQRCLDETLRSCCSFLPTTYPIFTQSFRLARKAKMDSNQPPHTINMQQYQQFLQWQQQQQQQQQPPPIVREPMRSSFHTMRRLS